MSEGRTPARPPERERVCPALLVGRLGRRGLAFGRRSLGRRGVGGAAGLRGLVRASGGIGRGIGRSVGVSGRAGVSRARIRVGRSRIVAGSVAAGSAASVAAASGAAASVSAAPSVVAAASPVSVDSTTLSPADMNHHNSSSTTMMAPMMKATVLPELRRGGGEV
jgi:hypothetical protein